MDACYENQWESDYGKCLDGVWNDPPAELQACWDEAWPANDEEYTYPCMAEETEATLACGVDPCGNFKHPCEESEDAECDWE